MDEIHEMRRRNQDIAEKFRLIEDEISTSGDTLELFETLVFRIEKDFSIPFVWLSIVDRPELTVLIRELQLSANLADRINIIDEKVFLDLTSNSEVPVLANENLKPFYRLLPRNNKYLIRSLAIAPLWVTGVIIGSVNHGDSSAHRYEPSMDTALLGQMAAKVSACLARLLPVTAESEEHGG